MIWIESGPEDQTIALNAIAKLGTGGAVIWSRAGERRLIPSAVIANAFALLGSWAEAVKAGVIEDVPESALSIHWDSTLSLPSLPSRVTVEQLGGEVGFGMIEDQRGAGDKSRPAN